MSIPTIILAFHHGLKGRISHGLSMALIASENQKKKEEQALCGPPVF